MDALIEIHDPAVTFADAEAALSNEPYELPYEPLGGTPDLSVVLALDLGLPALREPTPARPRDLILGAYVRLRPGRQPVELGGRCAKDVAGYELRKLLYGARGRLGDLCAVRLRLLPRPSDSLLVHGPATALDTAVTLCRRMRSAALPFRYLGILVAEDGTANVTGRLELNGGTLERHRRTLSEAAGPASLDVSSGNCWTDPVMRFLAGSAALVGAPHVLTPCGIRLARLATHGRAIFVSVGHGRVWWRGQPPTDATDDGLLVKDVIAAFKAAPR